MCTPHSNCCLLMHTLSVVWRWVASISTGGCMFILIALWSNACIYASASNSWNLVYALWQEVPVPKLVYASETCSGQCRSYGCKSYWFEVTRIGWAFSYYRNTYLNTMDQTWCLPTHAHPWKTVRIILNSSQTCLYTKSSQHLSMCVRLKVVLYQFLHTWVCLWRASRLVHGT